MQANFFSKLRPSREKFAPLRLSAGSIALLALAACQPERGALSPEAAAVQRQNLYIQLEQLEAQLPQPIPLDLYGIPTRNPRVWLRDTGVPGPAAFENARVRRIIAMEELSDLQAPEADAPDFNAFWEIHGAYVRAGEVSRFSHGQTGLIYSRPYPIDQLSGPHLAALDIMGVLQLDYETADVPMLLGLLPEISNDIRSAHRRLAMDAVSGVVPPEDILRDVTEQITRSPFASETAFEAWRAQWEALETEEFPRSDWTIQLAEGVERLLLPEMTALLATIEALPQTASLDATAGATSAYYDALLQQVTSGVADAEDCLFNAQRLAEETEAAFDQLLFDHWNDHAPLDDEGNALLDNVAIPDNPLRAMMVWQQRAPLVPPPAAPAPDAEGQPVAPPTPEAAEDAPPESFVNFERALEHLSSYLAAYSVQRLPEYELTPVLPPETPPRGPAPPVPEQLYDAPSSFEIFDTVPLRVSTAFLEANPMALSVVDILQTYYPGHAFREMKEERREDLPLLSRELRTLAFDLGWPAYALDVLARRSAFEDAPQLETAMLYQRLVIFTEAEAEIGLLTGTMSEDDAANLLTTRLGIADADARERLQTFKAEPGLGCAATEGYLIFTSLRERARGVLGNRLNIRDFHDVLLLTGSRPLALVERDVDNWIASQVN